MFTVLDEHDNMYFVKGDNPLALYHYKNCGLYIYASTEAILDRTLTRLGIISIEHQKINTSCGDILKIDSTGAMEQGMFDTPGLPAQSRISTDRLRRSLNTALRSVTSLRTSSLVRIFSAKATLP